MQNKEPSSQERVYARERLEKKSASPTGHFIVVILIMGSGRIDPCGVFNVSFCLVYLFSQNPTVLKLPDILNNNSNGPLS